VKDEILTRLFVDSILYAAQTGCHWRTLPPRYGKWNSIFKRFRDWVVFGVFDYLHNEMLNYNIENDSGKEFIKILNLAMLKTDTYSVIYKNNIAFI
jgi:transposase